MNEYLTDLLARTLDESDKNVSIGSNTISWKALREAEKLTDVGFIPQLIEFIDNEKNKDKRRNACFILGNIAKNTNHTAATQFLINRIEKEQDKYVISSLLDRIQYLQKSADTDIQPIINALKSKEWLIRSSAILALKHTDNQSAEDALIDILEISDDEYDLSYANCTLANIGTKKSLPYLVKLLSHKKQDVSNSALTAIIENADETYLPLFLEKLANGKNKTVALGGVLKYGNENIVPHLIKRIKELVAKQRVIEIIIGKNRETEIMAAMEFLKKYADKKEVKEMFDLLLTKKYDLLWEQEKQWLENNKDVTRFWKRVTFSRSTPTTASLFRLTSR